MNPSLRWILSFVLMIVSYLTLKESLQHFDLNKIFTLAPLLTLSVGSLVLAGILIGRPLAELIATPILLWIDELYFPRERNACPPLDLKLAHFFERERDWDKAAVEYQRILHYYPKHCVLWVGLIRSLHENDEHEEAEQMTKVALKKLKSDAEAQETLRALQEKWRQLSLDNPAHESEENVTVD